MVVDDLHLVGTGVRPDEAYAPLVIDPDGMLAGAVAFQRFEPIRRRNAQIVERDGLIEHGDLPQRPLHEGGRKTFWGFAERDPLGAAVLEGNDHRCARPAVSCRETGTMST